MDRLNLHRVAVDQRFAADPRSTIDARVRGEFPPDMHLFAWRRLIWAAGFVDRGYWLLQDKVDWSGVHPVVMRHAGLCLMRAKGMDIPLYVSEVSPLSFRLLHCRYHGELQLDEWQLIADLQAQERPADVVGDLSIPFRRDPAAAGWAAWSALEPIRLTPKRLRDAS